MANYNLSLPAETIDELLLWLDDKQDVIIKQTDLLAATGQSTTATMTQKAITDALGTKADADNVYTKTETDELIAPLATQEDLEAVEQEVAQIAGEAGLAEAVIDTDGAGTEQQFTFRKSGGDGGAFYRKIKGKTLAWNQLVNISASPVISDGLTFTPNADGSVSITGTPDSTGVFNYIDFNNAAAAGHTILIREKAVAGKYAIAYGSYYRYGENYDGWRKITNANSITRIGIYIETVEEINIRVNYEVVDLTQMFGAGNEPSTVADFEALYPDAYYPYNPGTLISNDAEAVETTGANQWDEEWEVGNINDDTGIKAIGDNRIRSKNYIPCFPNTAYYAIDPTNDTNIKFFFYDADKNFISAGNWISSAIFQTPSNAAYMMFKMGTAYGTTYNHDICINQSNPAINGQYFPYWKRTLQLGITTKEDTDGNVPFADGMKSAGTANDWCDKVGGEKRMGRLNLGDLNWGYRTPTYPYFYSSGQSQIKKPAVNGKAPNILCAKYITTDANSPYSGSISVCITMNTDGDINIYDPSFGSDTDALKAALSGVYLDYELDTHVPFTWAEPLNLGVKVDENGTERAVAPEGAIAPSAPFVADTTYTMSVARMVEILKNL